MANLFVISDNHFSHASSLKWENPDGSKQRPGFASVEELDEHMVKMWNSVVKPQDHVYNLGDVAMKRQQLHIVRRLNGHKRLVFGNHDIFEAKEYLKAGFEKVMGMRVLDGLILTHVPVHPSQLNRFKANIHGHTHTHNVMWDRDAFPDRGEDGRYICVCVEQINYTPISLEDIKKRLP